MDRKTSTVLAVGLVAWFFSPMLLGFGTSGVELHVPTMEPGVSDQGGGLPTCNTVHTFDSRYWGDFKTIQSNVWLTGCNNSAGELRLQSGPTCTATSFLGPGTATCTATPDGRNLKVVVHLVYPFGLNLIAGLKTTETFSIDPSGNYSAP